MLGRFGTKGKGKGAEDIGGPQTLRVTLVLSGPTAEQTDVDQLRLPDAEVSVARGNAASFAASGPALRRCDVVLIEFDPANPRDFEEFEQFVATHGGRLPVIGAVRELTVAVTRRVLRSDAIDVLAVPFTADELHQAVEAGRSRLGSVRGGGDGRRQGQIIAITGALGGVGATMLAVQCGQMVSEDRNVLLIDFDVQAGNVALYANLKPRLTLGDLVDAEDRLDGEFLRMVAERHKSGLSVIAAPPDMTAVDRLTPEFVDRLLDLATQQFDLVLVDLPGLWIDWSATVMQKADLVALVTVMTVPGIHQARRQLDVFEANSMSDRVRVVLNRMTAPLFGKIDVAEAEQALKHRVHHAVTNDYPTVSAAIDEGRLVGQVKVKARVEKDIRTTLAAMLAELAENRMPA